MVWSQILKYKQGFPEALGMYLCKMLSIYRITCSKKLIAHTERKLCCSIIVWFGNCPSVPLNSSQTIKTWYRLTAHTCAWIFSVSSYSPILRQGKKPTLSSFMLNAWAFLHVITALTFLLPFFHPTIFHNKRTALMFVDLLLDNTFNNVFIFLLH